jgi:hypothetical protein
MRRRCLPACTECTCRAVPRSKSGWPAARRWPLSTSTPSRRSCSVPVTSTRAPRTGRSRRRCRPVIGSCSGRCRRRSRPCSTIHAWCGCVLPVLRGRCGPGSRATAGRSSTRTWRPRSHYGTYGRRSPVCRSHSSRRRRDLRWTGNRSVRCENVASPSPRSRSRLASRPLAIPSSTGAFHSTSPIGFRQQRRRPSSAYDRRVDESSRSARRSCGRSSMPPRMTVSSAPVTGRRTSGWVRPAGCGSSRRSSRARTSAAAAITSCCVRSSMTPRSVTPMRRSNWGATGRTSSAIPC